MHTETEKLGGRLPLLDPHAMSPAQSAIYTRLERTMVPWGEDVGFRTSADDGRLIGPFNAMLFNPDTGAHFLDLHDAEEQHSSLSARIRQIVILAVGAVWSSQYELYAHAAAARKAGISDDIIQALVAGDLPEQLSEQEKLAQRFAHQLSADRRIDPVLYAAAEAAFSRQGVVDIVYLTGVYHITCAFLNAFEIPVPD